MAAIGQAVASTAAPLNARGSANPNLKRNVPKRCAREHEYDRCDAVANSEITPPGQRVSAASAARVVETRSNRKRAFHRCGAVEVAFTS